MATRTLLTVEDFLRLPDSVGGQDVRYELVSRRPAVRIQYFEDTDTLYLVFRDAAVDETRDLDENTLVEFDKAGNLVSMTIEHARERADVANFSFQQVPVMRPVA
jgi:uncharacterized protein YuzE